MTHTETIGYIRSDELQRFRNGDTAPITLPEISRQYCQHDGKSTRDCQNAVCRWSDTCAIGRDDYDRCRTGRC